MSSPSKPRGKVARRWYDEATRLRARADAAETALASARESLTSEYSRTKTLQAERDQWRKDAERIDRDFQRLNAMLAEIRMALQRERP